MRLIAVYSVYDGLELLEGSIKQIYSECWKIVLHYQSISNFGELDESVEPFVRDIASKYSKIRMLEFEPELTVRGGDNEKRKRVTGKNHADDLGASHFLFMDCDEYYLPDEFRQAKQMIIEKGYDSSACRLFTYYKHPTYRLTPLENYYVPFIHSVTLDSGSNYPVYADPTRLTRGDNFYEFQQDELMMHHFSWIRHDIAKKVRNSSASVNWKDMIPGIIERYNDFKPSDRIINYPGFSIVEVENVFHIKLSNDTPGRGASYSVNI